VGDVNLWQPKGNGDMKTPRILVFFSGHWRTVTPGLRYSLFKAADEKIPLSVGHVNNKPQHIVFCCHFPHPPSKPRHSPVESA
jgi:hypothetical protein